MKSYYIIKRLSKSLVLLSLLAVIISGGSFFVSRTKIGADTNQTPSYKVFSENNVVEKILANNIGSSNVTGYDFAKNPNSDLKDVGTCELGEKCYMIWNTNDWSDPSIKLTDNSPKPAWTFLQEVLGKAQNAGDSAAVDQIKSVRANYVGAAFNKDVKSNFEFTPIEGWIVISDSAFFDQLKKAGIEEKDPYMDFYNDNNVKVAKMKFASSYPEAKENSAWLGTANFVIGSILNEYKKAGFETNDYENAIYVAMKNYMLSISNTNKGKILSFTYPSKILLTKIDEGAFKFNIDTSTFPIPKNGYKTKIFLKPISQKAANIFITLGPLASNSYQFSWTQLTDYGYVDASGKQVTPTSDDYNINFPQQYYIKAITYDGDTEKESIEAIFETYTVDTSSDTKTITDASPSLNLSVTPSVVKQGGKIAANIIATTSTDPAKSISKVILYACTGTSSDVAKNDSSSCTIKNKDGAAEDAIKQVFEGPSLIFKDGKANMSFEWDTSGSAIGNHALMAKAFRDNSTDPYIHDSKTAATVQVTNTEVGPTVGGTANGGQFNNLLASQFSNPATNNATGSSLKTTGELATRIVNILLIAISALSAIAIIVGGVFYITAGGDQQKAEKGKKTVLYACVGVAIAILTYVIESAVLNIINDLIK